MTDLERLTSVGSEEERGLLRAGRAVRPSAASKRRALLALGLVTASTVAPTTAAALLKAFKASVAAVWPALASKWPVVVVVTTLGASIAVVQTRRAHLGSAPPLPPQAAESRAPKRSNTVASPAPDRTESPVAAPIASATPTAVVLPPKPAVPSRPSEVELFDAARSRLASGDAGGALKSLRDQMQAYPRGNLAAEAKALRIEALEAAGQHQRALDEARAFLAYNPNGLMSHRVRRWLERHSSP